MGILNSHWMRVVQFYHIKLNVNSIMVYDPIRGNINCVNYISIFFQIIYFTSMVSKAWMKELEIKWHMFNIKSFVVKISVPRKIHQMEPIKSLQDITGETEIYIYDSLIWQFGSTGNSKWGQNSLTGSWRLIARCGF